MFSSLSKSNSQFWFFKLCHSAVVEAVSKGIHNSPQLKRYLFQADKELPNLISQGDIKCSETKFRYL